MLVNLASGPGSLYPHLYPCTLVVEVRTDNQSSCGVFSGRHGGFESKLEMDQPMPRIHWEAEEDESAIGTGTHRFLIDRPARVGQDHQLRIFHYAVVSWVSSPYLAFSSVHKLVLSEQRGFRSGESEWEVQIDGPLIKATVCLGQYLPEALKRGEVALSKRDSLWGNP
jgi:hypothetical protein